MANDIERLIAEWIENEDEVSDMRLRNEDSGRINIADQSLSLYELDEAYIQTNIQEKQGDNTLNPVNDLLSVVCDTDISMVDDSYLEAPESPESHLLDSEPIYCTCNRPYDGAMIACDNESCPIEWFHYGNCIPYCKSVRLLTFFFVECVKLKSTPVGIWYCDHCRKHVT